MSDEFGLIAEAGQAVPLQGVAVSGDLLGRGARVKVAQRFRNSESAPLEVVYRFPLPESAAVCGFSARVGERTIQGVVEEREAAFKMYDEALERGDGAMLLDQERPNIFTLSVGSLPAGAEAVVEIEYVTLLDQEEREVRFALPTTISPRYLPAGTPDEDGIPVEDRVHPEYAEQVSYGLSISLCVRNAEAVEAVESPSHGIKVQHEGDRIWVSFASGTSAMDRDFVLAVTRRKTGDGRAYRSYDGKNAFFHLELGADGLRPEDQKPQEVDFMLDCSGSMQGDSITQAKRALEVCLKALDSRCSFNVVRFGSSFQMLFPRPEAYSERSLGNALGWLSRVPADLGGTEVLPALAAVLRAQPSEAARSVILLTDGEVGNEAEVMSLMKASAAGTRLFCVGIGAGPNEHAIRGLARAGRGASAFIFPGERIEPKVLGIFRKAVGPCVSALRIDWGGNAEQAPVEPSLMPDEEASIFARMSGDPHPSMITVTAEVDGKPMRWEIPVAEAGAGPLPIPQLWARERIRTIEESPESLTGRGSRQVRPATADAWKRQVLEIAREYGLSSSCTSWVAVEEREEKDKVTGEVVLRKVPTLVTVGWHGIGSVSGRAAAPAGMNLVDAKAWAPAPSAQIRARGFGLFHRKPAVSSDHMRLESFQAKGERGTARGAPALHGVSASDGIDRVLDLLSLQRAGGGFEVGPHTLAALGIDEGKVEAAAALLPGALEENRLILHTAIILAVLSSRFSGYKPEWAAAVKKSVDLLHRLTKSWGPLLGGLTVTRWAKELVTSAAAV